MHNSLRDVKKGIHPQIPKGSGRESGDVSVKSLGVLHIPVALVVPTHTDDLEKNTTDFQVLCDLVPFFP